MLLRVIRRLSQLWHPVITRSEGRIESAFVLGGLRPLYSPEHWWRIWSHLESTTRHWWKSRHRQQALLLWILPCLHTFGLRQKWVLVEWFPNILVRCCACWVHEWDVIVRTFEIWRKQHRSVGRRQVHRKLMSFVRMPNSSAWDMDCLMCCLDVQIVDAMDFSRVAQDFWSVCEW